MSFEQDLESIAGGKPRQQTRQQHAVYRRRDLRNGLADRLGIPDRDREPRGGRYGGVNAGRGRGRGGFRSKREFNDRRVKLTLLRIKNIPLETSDYEIEDMLNEIGEVASFRINDKKDSRVASVEFKDPQVLAVALETVNNKEVNGSQLECETFEIRVKAGTKGAAPSSVPAQPATHTRPPKPEPKTREELDQEMDEYMSQP